MTEARKLKVEPQLGLALIDIEYAHGNLVDTIHDLNIELKSCKSTERKIKKHFEKGKAKYKEIFGREWKSCRK